MLIIILAILIICCLELLTFLTVEHVRDKFQWMITFRRDENPEIDKEGLKKFIKHGYDSELGWVRKPNTEHDEFGKNGKTKYHINSIGARCNPKHEKLKKLISCYGDSFCFCRQNNDDETWEWFLSEYTKSNVLNFGVGNYGLDQSLLRLKGEYPKNKTKIVIMCVVPSTIVRIMCVWKHYNEFGNIFGFKPRFEIKNNKLVIIKNIIDSEDKFYKLEKYLKNIQEHDYFYKTKFKNEIIRFPYLLNFFKHPLRNFTLTYLVLSGQRQKAMMKIMEINLKLREKLYSNNDAINLFHMIIKEFVLYANKNNFKPVFLLIPQKDDVEYVSKVRDFYQDFITLIKKDLLTVDMTDYLKDRNDLDDLYSDDNKYGGHPSVTGNKYIAKILTDILNRQGYIK